MANPSPLLNLSLMTTGEEPNNWGSVLNNSVFEPLEDSIAGTLAIPLASQADVNLVDDIGASGSKLHQRYMILHVTGSPGGITNINLPASVTTGIWVVWNETSDSSSVVFKKTGQTGLTVNSGTIVWSMCNGTDVIAVSVANAVLATTATTATDADALGGVAAASYAKLDVGVDVQEFSGGQSVQRVALPLDAGSTYKPNLALSNSFYHLANSSFSITTPSNPKDGGQFSLLVKQGTGGNNTIDFIGSAYAFAGGNKPQLTQTLNAFDYFAFEYSTDLGRWLGSSIKNLVGV